MKESMNSGNGISDDELKKSMEMKYRSVNQQDHEDWIIAKTERRLEKLEAGESTIPHDEIEKSFNQIRFPFPMGTIPHLHPHKFLL